jgi:hypothetical protein
MPLKPLGPIGPRAVGERVNEMVCYICALRNKVALLVFIHLTEKQFVYFLK